MVKGCKTPNTNLEIHHIRKLYRNIDYNNLVIQKGKTKRLNSRDIFKSGLKRKQVVLCRRHHQAWHRGTLNLDLID